jgi:hypothetical protein
MKHSHRSNNNTNMAEFKKRTVEHDCCECACEGEVGNVEIEVVVMLRFRMLRLRTEFNGIVSKFGLL